MKPSAAGACILLVNIHAHQHWCLCPALSSFKGRMRQSSQRGEGMGQERKAAKPHTSGHKGEGEPIHRGMWFCSVSRAGLEASRSSSFSPDRCGLIRRPGTGASCEAAGLTPLFTPLLPIPEHLLWAGSHSPSGVEKYLLSGTGLAQPSGLLGFQGEAAVDRSLIHLRRERK